MTSAKKDISGFILLVRLGIGHFSNIIPDNIDWPSINTLAYKHGLSAVVLDGIDCLPENKRPPKDFMLQWIGEVLQGYEFRYENYCHTIAELAAFYKAQGIKMMVLKGYACGLNWPKPEHRPCGDIDIWLFGKQKEADDLIGKEKSIKIDSTHHHHTVFDWHSFSVENHYDFINIHRYHSNKKYETLLKELGNDDSHQIELLGQTVYIPSANLHTLFLLRHSMMDFVASSLSLRQVMDWAFFVEKHIKEIDWNYILTVLDEYNMVSFFNLINAICVEDLGFDSRIFPEVQFLPDLKQRVLYDIVDPAYEKKESSNILKRLLYKYQRWHGNAWKQQLCFKESRWNNFYDGIRAKMIKPSA